MFWNERCSARVAGGRRGTDSDKASTQSGRGVWGHRKQAGGRQRETRRGVSRSWRKRKVAVGYLHGQCDNNNGKLYKYVCITTNQPDTKSNPNPNPNPTTKQHASVNIQLNIVTCPTYPEKFIRDNVVAPFVPTSVVIVTLPFACSSSSLIRLWKYSPRRCCRVQWRINFCPSCVLTCPPPALNGTQTSLQFFGAGRDNWFYFRCIGLYSFIVLWLNESTSMVL